MSRPEDAQTYQTEAQTVAALDHPNIVPVYDVGSNEETPFFLVSKYIDGTTLAQRIKEHRPSLTETVELVATGAETLHYAHRNALVHRDIKPSNILLDKSGKPFVADFGLVLRERDVGTGPRHVGTPTYMSPEQAAAKGIGRWPQRHLQSASSSTVADGASAVSWRHTRRVAGTDHPQRSTSAARDG